MTCPRVSTKSRAGSHNYARGFPMRAFAFRTHSGVPVTHRAAHKMGAGSVAEVVKLYLFATEAATPPVTGFPLPGHGERPIGNRQRTD